ncbi:MAG: tRNA (N(6)-L-threonylcarbamoyladenosine(37)-C(2))-methylthiotransferase MtaB [Clostridia bacterium]|nr:tRNA (N(6)-L-threonylcarbamoyladenosine(37)-C(2))-methylthiotransferase MtaB [Clostridia bacterium]
MNAVVFTLGCKVNDVESGSIIRGLKELGYSVSREFEKADVYVINTCAVTAEAERKSRQTIGKALKCNPNAKIIVCGCASEKDAAVFLEKTGVFAVVGAKGKNRVLQIVQSGFDKAFSGVQVCVENTDYEEMPLPECLKTRNFVKIQDGCNRFCSYCVIPYLRGRSRSRSADSAAEEVRQSKALETVITGIDLSAYTDGQGRDLSDLLTMVKDADTRLRLGSMEVSMITPRFLQALKGLKNFAPHFHLSLQSGSNKVLKSMNRHYTREEYLEKCAMIYDVFPFAGITTDIIVGFPTETEEDFLQSLKIVEEAGFSQIHAFPYSPREGTNAYKKYKELPSAVKKERVERILQAGTEQKEKYLRGFIGKTLCIVPERCINGVTEGYAENYIRVYVTGETGKALTKVRVTELYQDGVKAELI